MTKRILSVVIVLCMMLTFVPFIGSAATVRDGYLIIDNMKADSGDGWEWANGVLTLSQPDDITAIMFSVEAEVILAEDVTLRGALIMSDGGTITTGDYTLSVLGGLNGANVTIKESNVFAYSITVSEDLNIIDSVVTSDCGGMSNTISVYSTSLYVEDSIVTTASGVGGDYSSSALYVEEAEFVNSVVLANGSGYGIGAMNTNDVCAGVIRITNSSVYAGGGISAVATGISYTGEPNMDSLILNGADVTVPEGGVVAEGTFVDTYMTATFAGIADGEGEIAKSVVIEAKDTTLLPEGDVPQLPDVPENPDGPIEPEEPQEPEVQIGIYGEFFDNELYLNIVAENTHDRVALFYAEDTSVSAALITSSEYVEYEELGLRQWCIVIDAPTEATDFVVRCRDEETKSYKNGRQFSSFRVTPPYTTPVLEELYVGGVNAFETHEGEGWYFDAETRTLSLDNCTLTQASTFINADGEVINAVIYACGDLNIDFIGDCFIENRVEEIPEVSTVYSAIWVDPTYNDYAGDDLVVSGTGNLTVGLAISQEAYKTGLVEFSFAIYLYNEYSVDLTGLGIDTKVDVYGGVVGVPATYNVRPFPYAPAFDNGNKVTAYKNIEGTMLDEKGYDLNDNEAWRVVIETTSAGVDKDGVLNIINDGEAYGDGWSWENNVLTLGDINFRYIYFQEGVTSAKIVLTKDVTIDGTALTEEEKWVLMGGIMFWSLGTLEIDSGEYTLTIKNDHGCGIDAYGTVIIKGNVVLDTTNAGWEGISVTGDLIIEDAVIYSEAYGIIAYTIYDAETYSDVCGNISIKNSKVYVSTTYSEDEYGNIDYLEAIYAYGDIVIENSVVSAIGVDAGVMANNISISNSEVVAYGINTAIRAFFSMDIDNSTITAESDFMAFDIANSYYTGEVSEGVFVIKGSKIKTPEKATVALATLVDENGNLYYTNTIVGDYGAMASSVYMEAANYADYEIINGKLIITVVTESRINRIALYDINNNCIRTFNTYKIDENGNYVWTIKMDAPTEEIQYIIKGRDAEANSYKKGFTLPTLTIEPEVVFEDVTVETRGDKVYVIATTVSENYDRVAIVNPVDGSYVKYTRNYKVVDGKYEWTIFFDYVEGMENLIVKARDIRTNRYNNAQAVEITVEAKVEPVIDVEITDYDENRILVTVTTVPDLYRVKIAYADDATSYIAYARNPVEKTDDAWTWQMVITKPDETTEYAVDIAYVKAYARYFTYVTYEVEA